MRITLILSLILSVLMVMFALMNNQSMPVNFGLFRFDGPIALVLIVTFILGVGVGLSAMLPGRMKIKKQLKALEKQHGPITTEMSEEPALEPVETVASSGPLDPAKMPFPPPPDPTKEG